ncbi:MAG: phosphatase PAP2 family protein [Novosphingobium sp.]
MTHTNITSERELLGFTAPASLQQPNRIAGHWMAAKIALSGLAVAAMMIRTGLRVAPENLGFAAASLLMFGLATARIWARRAASRFQEQLRDFSEDILLFLSICLLGVIASYPLAADSSGFADAGLHRMDQFMHFDWLFWYRTVSHFPALQLIGVWAYACIYVSPIILLGYFAWTHQRLAARQFLVTFWLAIVLTLLLFPLFPAEGPLAYLWHGRIPYMPTSALYQEQLIPALRTGRVTSIDMGALRGLVCAPSFHTVSAVVYLAAAWPIKRLRWVLVSVNVAMLLATPIEGTHYLSDMIAGLFVAVFAILAVRTGLRLVWASNGKLAQST